MATGRSLHVSPVVAHDMALGHGTAPQHLPAEITTEILDYLHVDDLWRVAASSRALRAVAWRSGLYIHRRIIWGIFEGHVASLATFRDIVQHVLHHGLRLSFSFSLSVSNRRWATPRPVHEFIGPALLELLSLVTAALPVIVFLELHIGNHAGPIWEDALRHPAPYLMEMKLSRSYMPGTCAVPMDLFTGSAPRLRRVVLVNVPLGLSAIPAFSHVLFVGLRDVERDVVLVHHFPRLRSLRLRFSKGNSSWPTLDGLSLRKISVDYEEDYFSLIPEDSIKLMLGDIPAVEYVVRHMAWREPFWQRDTDDALNVRLTYYKSRDIDSTSIIIVPEHRKWRRRYCLDRWHSTDICPIQDMPGLRERLTYLRMDNVHLVALLECKSLALDALHEMQIDLRLDGARGEMLWPPDWIYSFYEYGSLSFDDCDESQRTFARESYAYVDCRNLKTLTLFALDEAMCVESREAAFLGRALSQTARPKRDRAVLALVGVDFHKPTARNLLGQTFSAVREHDHAGRDSIADYEAGLWDEGV